MSLTNFLPYIAHGHQNSSLTPPEPKGEVQMIPASFPTVYADTVFQRNTLLLAGFSSYSEGNIAIWNSNYSNTCGTRQQMREETQIKLSPLDTKLT